MKARHVVGATLLAAMLSACAFQKQAIQLQPQVQVTGSQVGAGRMTMVNVADERPRATLGTRGVGGMGEQLTIEGDLAAIVKRAVEDGLRQHGFAVNGPIANQLRVEIRNLDYAVNSGFWTGRLNVEFLLKGVCIKNGNRPYEQTYRGELRENVQVVQGEAANNRYVNDAVTEGINALLNDQAMMACLAG